MFLALEEQSVFESKPAESKAASLRKRMALASVGKLGAECTVTGALQGRREPGRRRGVRVRN